MCWVRETTATDFQGRTRRLRPAKDVPDGFYKGQYIESKYTRKIRSVNGFADF